MYNNKTILFTAIILASLHSIAQDRTRLRVVYYDVEGLTSYEVKGCVPGSNVEFFSNKKGYECLKNYTADKAGELLVTTDARMAPQFIANPKRNSDRSIKGAGTLFALSDKAFVLDELKAETKNSSTTISWNAAVADAGHYRFDVLKSTDGNSYTKVYTQAAIGNAATAYMYNDPAGSGNASYKIRVYDDQNTVSYLSRVLGIAGSDMIRLYPTVAAKELNLQLNSLDKQTAYSIIDATGITVQKGMINNVSTVLNVQDLPPGNYLLTVATGKKVPATARFIKE